MLTVAALSLVGCARIISPVAPPPYRADIPAPYSATWTAIVRALEKQNVPLRAIARDSGVVATDNFVTPIGVWADCGRIGDEALEGEAVVAFTIFAEADGDHTRMQLNSKMHTRAYGRGVSGRRKSDPVLQCASTGRFEANLVDAVVERVKH